MESSCFHRCRGHAASVLGANHRLVVPSDMIGERLALGNRCCALQPVRPTTVTTSHTSGDGALDPTCTHSGGQSSPHTPCGGSLIPTRTVCGDNRPHMQPSWGRLSQRPVPVDTIAPTHGACGDDCPHDGCTSCFPLGGAILFKGHHKMLALSSMSHQCPKSLTSYNVRSRFGSSCGVFTVPA